MSVRAAGSIFAAALSLVGVTSAVEAAPKHVILIMMENHGTGALLGSSEDAPFLNELIEEKGVRYATQYYGVTHPSLPNCLSLISGDDMGFTTIAGRAPTSGASPTSSSPERKRSRWTAAC